MRPATRLPRDPALPHLATVLDAGRMRRILATYVATGRQEIVDCVIERVKYKPRRNCLVSYRIQVADRPSGRCFAQRLLGRTYPPGGSSSRFARAQTAEPVAPEIGPPVLHIEDLDMVLWAFPNERKLNTLASLSEAAHLEAILPELVARRLGSGWRLAGFRHAVVHYTPEHTCCVRVDLEATRGGRMAGRRLTLFGKTYYNDQGKEAWLVARGLWASRNLGFVVPRPITYQPGVRTFWQEMVPGNVLAMNAGDAASFRAAGIAIARLHQQPVACARRIEVADVVDRLHAIVDLLCCVRPDLARPAEEIVTRLADCAPVFDALPSVTLHGDLHAKNILIDRGRVALIDLDNVAMGSPLLDLGSFVAALLYRNLLLCQAPHRAMDAIEAFINGYRSQVPWPVMARRLDWFIAAALLHERVYRVITRLKPGRLESLAALVHLAGMITSDGLEAATRVDETVA